MENMNLDNIGNELADAYKQGFEESKELIKKVEKWGEEKGITNPENIEKQFMKFIEEALEFKTELEFYRFFSHQTKNKLKDYSVEAYNKYKDLQIELGDVLVTLIIMAKQLDIDLEECLYLAYEKIKGRKGKTIDGVFIKEEDL